MQTIRPSLSSPDRGGIDTAVAAARLASCVVQIVRNLRTILRAWRERQATRRALSRADDRLLKDIGLHRSQIDSVALSPMAERIAQRRRLTAHAARCTELKTRPRRRRYGPTNAPWISDAITIRRDDLF